MTQFEIIYYETPAGGTPIEDFLAALSPKARAKCLHYMNLFCERGFSLPRNKLEKLESSLWELKPEYENEEYRFLLTPITRTAVIVHAVDKKSGRLRLSDLQLARQRAKEVKEYYASLDR